MPGLRRPPRPPRHLPPVVIDAPDYGVDGDDSADDTAALREALAAAEGQPLYLHWGTYLVSGSLLGQKADGSSRGGFNLVGEDRNGTVLKLVDGAPGFGDPAARPR